MQCRECRYVGKVYSLFEKGDSRHKIVEELTNHAVASMTNLGVQVFVPVSVVLVTLLR
jgi:hypothetical protein